MSICSNTWTDALHAAHCGLLMSYHVKGEVGWSILRGSLASSVYGCVDVSITADVSCSYYAVCSGDDFL